MNDIFIAQEALAKGSRAAAENFLLKALYLPLDQLLKDGGENLDPQGIKPKAVAGLVVRHLKEKQAEKTAALGIESLGVIEDGVSKSVAELYEVNPYPRWLSLHKPEAGSRRKQMAAHFAENELAFMEGDYTVLIAGSGTGQQAIDAALGYGPETQVTAIDISLASLAYGRKMAEKFQADNLRFLQCDILNAAQIEGAFDIIECIGVLHHMDDPWQGWRVLLEKLKPGGVMKIALYSRAARRNIASLRENIQAEGLDGEEDTIRTYRQDILSEGEGGKGAFLRQSSDFYSLSNFRDLMFHVSEQHMTIPEIMGFLNDNALSFQGFKLPPDIEEGYPSGDAANDLTQWHLFEDAHPETFKGMYVFWCRKD